jgi:serpin B
MTKQYWISRALVGLIVLSFAITASGLIGCAAPGLAGSVVKADVVQSDKPRLPALSLDESRMPELAEGNAEFALDLYRVLSDKEENLFYSPYSLSVALAMTYAGARGETERQMAEALHYTLPQAQLHPAFNALDQALVSRGEGEDEEALRQSSGQAFRLYMANAIWPQQGYPFLDAFLDTLAENYGAGLRAVDFSQAKEARRLINQWVSDQTERRVRELLPPDSVDGETALVLTNAVYFKAVWMYPFAEDRIHSETFTLLDGGQVTMPMMEQVAQLGYAERPGARVVELPYAGGELSMVIVLPEAGTFDEFARELDAGELDAILSEIEPMGVRLAIPKFRFDAEFKLKDALMELGMVDAFGEADFSGMDGTLELFIDEVYHKAFVAVDEAGTEATAASAVVVGRKGGPKVEQELRIDRPFIFLIRDIKTGTILFLGQVVNPVA